MNMSKANVLFNMLPFHYQLPWAILNFFAAHIKFVNIKTIFFEYFCQELIWKIVSTLHRKQKSFALEKKKHTY